MARKPSMEPNPKTNKKTICRTNSKAKPENLADNNRSINDSQGLIKGVYRYCMEYTLTALPSSSLVQPHNLQS